MTEKRKSSAPILAVSAAVGVILFGLSPAFRYLLYGWILFLWRVLPEVQVNWALVAIASAAFVGIVFLIHHLARWIRLQQSTEESSLPWRLRSSLAISALIAVMFIAGIAATGVTHQTVWLLRSPTDILVQKIDVYWPHDDDMAVANQMRSVDLGIRSYAARNKRLPFESDGVDDRSWVTRIVGHMYSSAKSFRDETQPWDHESNRIYFSAVFPDLLNAALENAPQHNADGYGVSHFELNRNIQNVTLEQYDRGTSQTLLMGEVNANFQPWGKPNTYRQVELGLNRDANGFGGPSSRDGVMFLLLDGSVRTISDSVDPQVLRAMANP